MKLASIQLSVIWAGLFAALCACGSSHPQSNSNTNWLRECSATKECNGNELCACGVCTIACVSDDACQNSEAPDAQCISVAVASCAGPSKGAVCTASCKRDAQCGDGELSCVDGSCIETQSVSEQPERDGAVEPDAEVDRHDGGSPDAEVDRPDGSRDSGEPVRDASEPSSCEQLLDCAADSACLNGRCQHLWSGNGCEPATEARPACDSDVDCAQGTVCHVDGTCIEPGKCDRFGMTTLATLGDIGAMVVTKDSVFVLERGSEDALGNHRSDGAIQRVAIADGDLQAVVGNIYRPLDLKVDSERVYWRQGASGELAFGWADRADGGNRVSLPLEGAVGAGWVLGPDHIYALITKQRELYDLFRIAKGTSTLEHLNDESGLQPQPGMSIDSDYLYFDDTQRWSLADNTLLDPTVASRCALPPSFIDSQRVYCEWGLDGTSFVGYVGKVDSRQIALAELPDQAGKMMYLVKAFRDHVYFAYGRPIDDPRVPVDSVVQRAPITAGETETVALLADGSHLIDISDQGLFSIQGHRLVRQMIDDYASGVSPAQGAAGAPCFGDQSCDDGLSCVDALCVVPAEPPPTCEERLGCGAGFACFREHCQQLWSGNGCDAALAARPTCATDADCDQGLVCHVDGTCIEPGKCDRFGMTTLASVGDVAAMTVAKDSVFVLDKSTDDALGNDQSTGAILSVSIADGTVQTVIDNLYRPLDMKVDGSRVYWRHGASGEIGFGWVDRADGGNPGDLALETDVLDLEWLLSSDHVYVLMVKQPERDYLFRFAKGTTTLEPLTDQGLHVAYGMGLDRDYVYFDHGRRWSLADSMVLEPTAASENVTDPSFIDHDRIFHVWDAYVGYTVKADNHQVALTTLTVNDGPVMYWLKAYRDHVYWMSGRFAEDPAKESVVERAPLTLGDPETVAFLPDGTRFAEIGDRGLFSIQGHRLVREVIEDYASGPSPAQGAAGAPCFGDATCDSGLSCVEALCE